MKHIDISEDFHLFRVNNGIELISSEMLEHTPMHHDLNHTVKSILALPCSIFFYDLHNSLQLVNEFCAEVCGFDSSKAALNKSLFDTGKPESAAIICENNNEVSRTNKMKMIEEEFYLKNQDIPEHGLSIKLPWYNKKHQIIGVFGLTVVFGKHKLDELLTHTLNIGLLSQDKYFNKLHSDKYHFTKREKEIIYLLVKKNAAKDISNQLCVSYRTIEKHIENIKNKLHVKSKSDIIAKIMEQ